MAYPAKLCIVINDTDVRKLVLQSGIPETIQDLKLAIMQAFEIPCEFSLMYEDKEFGKFFTLTDISDIEDKGTVKIVKEEPIVLTLNMSSTESEFPVNLSTSESNYSLQETDTSSLNSSTSHDTIPWFSDSEAQDQGRSHPWPAKFVVPPFSYDVEMALQTGNQAYLKDGTFLNESRITSALLEKLAEEMFSYTAYPSGLQMLAVAEALIDKYPCLKEPGSFNGIYGWQQRIKYKMANYRQKLRNRNIVYPELAVNSKKQRLNDKEQNSGFKKPQKAEVNYLPPLTHGDTKDLLEQFRVDLLHEVTVRNNEKNIDEKMERTFPIRRNEVVKECPSVKHFKERWPALFSEKQIKHEFRRITTINLERTFLEKLDLYTPKLLEILSKKGGVSGIKIRPLLNLINEDNIESKRDAVIQALMEYLGEPTEGLIKEYWNKPINFEEEAASFIMNICTFKPPGASKCSIVIEGVEVIGNCSSLSQACVLLMGAIYAINLSYPKPLKYTFEVFQKLFLELDVLKMSCKVQSLKRKLLL